jgi:TonB family protein
MHALFYRPNSRWRTISAFGVAAAIHLSAVAFGSLHREQTNTSFAPFTDIDVEPTRIGVAPAVPPAQEAELPRSPELPPSREFVDVRTPAPRTITKQVSPTRSGRLQAIDTSRAGMGKVLAFSTPRPKYPYEARWHHITGSGFFILTVDPMTGSVVDAVITDSTGFFILDDSALRGFRRWRFKRGTAPKVRIPFTFALTGIEL